MKIVRYPLYRSYIKRWAGAIIALFGLILLWPVMLFISILIIQDSKGSIIFRQQRLGFDKKPFTIYKFRTMVSKKECDSRPACKNDPRITKVGAFLRRTSLDELPQLINIIKGDMCIIGPRPILREEFLPYQEHAKYHKRFEAKPGLFCTVDTRMRAMATREIQFQMDAEYAENITMVKDIILFIKIVLPVLKQENIYKK